MENMEKWRYRRNNETDIFTIWHDISILSNGASF